MDIDYWSFHFNSKSLRIGGFMINKQNLEDFFIDYLSIKTGVSPAEIAYSFKDDIDEVISKTFENLDWIVDDINEWVEEKEWDEE